MPPRAFMITATPEAPIAATIHQADAGPRDAALLVLAHGAGAGQESPFIQAYAAALAARGLTVVTFNFHYRQSGRRTPDRTAILEQTFRAAIAGAVAACGSPPPALFIGGKSMGGRIATHLAAAPRSSAPPSPELAGAVALGYPLAPPRGRRTGDRVSHLRALRVPTLIVQGTRDPFGGPAEIREAVSRDGATPPLTILPVEGGDHSFGVLKSSGLDQAAVHGAIHDAIADWARGVQGVGTWPRGR